MRRTEKTETYGRLVWRRFRRSWLGMTGMFLLIGLAIVVVLGRFLAPMDPDVRHVPYQPPSRLGLDAQGLFALNATLTGAANPVTLQPELSLTRPEKVRLTFLAPAEPYRILGPISLNHRLLGPAHLGQREHLMGADRFGRDIFSRGLVATRVSLLLALTVVSLTTVTGLLVGSTAGYLGGPVDRWLQRLVDVVLAFPQLPLYLTLGALIPVTVSSGLFVAILIATLSFLGWAGLSREIRGKTLMLARMDYVRAAVAMGADDRRIILRHIAPNLFSHVLVSFTLSLPTIVLLESFLGFLGLAVKPPMISWGLMLQDVSGYAAIGSYPFILSPVLFVFVTVFAFNAVGDALRDAVDPY